MLSKDPPVSVRLSMIQEYIHIKRTAEALVEVVPDCSCIGAYRGRGMRAPDCIRCNLQPQLDKLIEQLGGEWNEQAVSSS